MGPARSGRSVAKPWPAVQGRLVHRKLVEGLHLFLLSEIVVPNGICTETHHKDVPCLSYPITVCLAVRRRQKCWQGEVSNNGRRRSEEHGTPVRYATQTGQNSTLGGSSDGGTSPRVRLKFRTESNYFSYLTAK
jgi:hypothetical protein